MAVSFKRGLSKFGVRLSKFGVLSVPQNKQLQKRGGTLQRESAQIPFLQKGCSVLVVTTNNIPGWEIQRVCGEVFGLTVRSRNIFPSSVSDSNRCSVANCRA
ncbi:hypothetical protein DIJ64_13635 [Mycobacterium leprae]|uniref:Uncharacterized protein n=1 Tax=Mycobacterium leprae TaxID=1769 RepID=A0AAD2JEI9_MYCLR|nr:hypothetical protein DIJ64_13635 [Mycobacterium leprae]